MAYPAVLLITAENDPRVASWQSSKFAAALQKANTSPHPILLITSRGEGHGVASSQRVGSTGAALNFFAEELGLAPGAPPWRGYSTQRAAVTSGSQTHPMERKRARSHRTHKKTISISANSPGRQMRSRSPLQEA